MKELENPTCPKCGHEMQIHFVESSGMDITPTGLMAYCARCQYRMKINSLDEKY